MDSAIVFSVSWFSHSLCFGLIVLSCVLYRVVYNIFLSPLSAIPGPWYAAVSDLWITTHVLRLRQCKKVHELFEEYGPVVRIGPNKVVFNDISTMRNVYSVHKFDKSTYYKSLLTNNNNHAMTTLEHIPHSIRKKGYAPHYVPANIAKFQPEIQEVVLDCMNALEGVAGKAPVECLALLRHLMVDVVVSTTYGYRLGAVGNYAMDVKNPLSTAIHNFPIRGILRSTVPSWAWNLVCRIPNNWWRQICNSDQIMAEFVSGRVYEMRAEMNAGKIGESEKIPMLQRLLEYRYSPIQQMPDHDIISECMGHMVAASDTTSTTMSYILWELSRRPDVITKLQAELDENMVDGRQIPDISVLQELPYLNGLIKEALRLYSAAPSLLERVVPSSTSKNGPSNEIFDLMGYALPPGTIVSTQAWTMHRDASIFPSPNDLLPERWIASSSTRAEDLFTMSQHMIPFGTGPRVCGGQQLAQTILKMVIAAIVRNFDIVAPPETNEKSMEVKDSFVIFPAAMECKLIFIPRQL